jgi:hypothetical protein
VGGRHTTSRTEPCSSTRSSQELSSVGDQGPGKDEEETMLMPPTTTTRKLVSVGNTVSKRRPRASSLLHPLSDSYSGSMNNKLRVHSDDRQQQDSRQCT